MHDENHIDRAARRATLRKLVTTGALGAMGAGGILGLIQRALAAGSLPATPGIHHVKGEVMVDNAHASIGLVIRPGQTVTTGPGAEAVYVLGSDAFVQRQNSKVSFSDSSGADVMRVISGTILSVFGRGKRQIVTNTAVIGIRGTGCYIETDATRTYFCLCYGEAELTPIGDPKQKETIRTEHHDHPIYINASGAKIMVPAQVINHTDQELVMLENLVGRWPPFYGKTGNKY